MVHFEENEAKFQRKGCLRKRIIDREGVIFGFKKRILIKEPYNLLLLITDQLITMN